MHCCARQYIEETENDGRRHRNEGSESESEVKTNPDLTNNTIHTIKYVSQS